MSWSCNISILGMKISFWYSGVLNCLFYDPFYREQLPVRSTPRSQVSHKPIEQVAPMLALRLRRPCTIG